MWTLEWIEQTDHPLAIGPYTTIPWRRKTFANEFDLMTWAEKRLWDGHSFIVVRVSVEHEE